MFQSSDIWVDGLISICLMEIPYLAHNLIVITCKQVYKPAEEISFQEWRFGSIHIIRVPVYQTWQSTYLFFYIINKNLLVDLFVNSE